MAPTLRQTFRYVTLPLLRPSLSLALILCVTGSLLAFDQFFILTKGAPNNSTVTVVQVIYREAFQRQNLGTAAALSIIVLAVLLALNAAAVQISARIDRELTIMAVDHSDKRRFGRTPLLRPDRRPGDHLSVSAVVEPGRFGEPAGRDGAAHRLRLRQFATLYIFGAGLPEHRVQQLLSCRS